MSKLRVGILQQASGLPAPYDAAAFVASAIVDQDFTGLGGTPGSWVVTGGTEDYNIDGLTQASGTALAMRLDISGTTTDDVPGWLLVNFSYPDVANTDILIATANVDDSRLQTASFVGDGGLAFTASVHRIETDNALDCSTGGPSGFQVDNPAANEGWLGVHSFPYTPQYEEGNMYLVTDTDGAALGSFSGDPCDSQFIPDQVKYVRFTLSGGAGDITIKRLLFWDSYPPDTPAFTSVMAELGFAVP